MLNQCDVYQFEPDAAMNSFVLLRFFYYLRFFGSA